MISIINVSPVTDFVWNARDLNIINALNVFLIITYMQTNASNPVLPNTMQIILIRPVKTAIANAKFAKISLHHVHSAIKGFI